MQYHFHPSPFDAILSIVTIRVYVSLRLRAVHGYAGCLCPRIKNELTMRDTFLSETERRRLRLKFSLEFKTDLAKKLHSPCGGIVYLQGALSVGVYILCKSQPCSSGRQYIFYVQPVKSQTYSWGRFLFSTKGRAMMNRHDKEVSYVKMDVPL